MRTTSESPNLDVGESATSTVGVLRQREWRISVAESLTGGLLAARIAEIPGSGDVFAGGLIAYHREVKHGLLGVPDGPVVSEVCAHAMARGVARLFCVNVGLAVTGVAGPETQDGRPVGLVYGACTIDGRVTTRRWHFDPVDPHQIRLATVAAALQLLDDHLTAHLIGQDTIESTPQCAASPLGDTHPPGPVHPAPDSGTPLLTGRRAATNDAVAPLKATP